MSVREPFKLEENAVAATAGTGLLLAIIAGLATGFGSDDTDLTRMLLFAGLALVAIGMGLWLVLLRPWERYDDLQTPYYTGHHHDHHDDEHHAEDLIGLAGGGAEEVLVVDAPSIEAQPVVEVNIPSEPVVASAADVEPVIEPLVEVAVAEDADPKFETVVETVIEVDAASDFAPIVEPAVDEPIGDSEPELEIIEPVIVPQPEIEEESVREPEPVMETPADDPAAAIALLIRSDTVFEVDPDREDNLRILEGIGAKTEEALKASGIKSFAAIANLSAEELEHIVKVEHKVRIVGSTMTWRKQAQLAAAGDFGALDDMKARIKSGYLYDDLTEIEGISPQIQDALYDAKIRSFDDLAAADITALQAALDKASIDYGRNISTWSHQAQLLVDGDLSGFEGFKATLN